MTPSATPTRLRAVPSAAEIRSLLERPLLDLVFEAARVHREHNDPNKIQCSQLLSIKTGACPEDCGYCPQSAHHNAGVERERLLDVDLVLSEAQKAKQGGADRFCMGAAWREVRDGKEFDAVLAMVRGVKDMGLEACVTLGMLNDDQAGRLKEAGLDYYNHNLDSGPAYYDRVVSTRCYQDRLDTLASVRNAGISVCCGGILGMGETVQDRAELLHELVKLDPTPESVPVNRLVAVEGTPMGENTELPWQEWVAFIAAARILLPETTIRLSAGRRELHEAAQAMAFLAGANSIFVGDKLLTTPNPAPGSDAALLRSLGLNPVGE
ncbi:MAG: biotin synthase BioB [Planctomycetota bacterium]